MWKTPLYLEHIDTYVFFLDTEGYIAGDLIKETSLIITLIISSLVLINIKFDSDYTSDFHIFSNILKKFSVFYEDNHEDLSLFLTKMLLIERDFNLTIDSTQTAYNILEKPSQITTKLTDITKSLCKLFKERDYMTCSQPTLDGNMLERIIMDLNYNVTEEFNEELNKIRDKIIFQTKPKNLFKVTLNSKIFGIFIKELIKEINEIFLMKENSYRKLLITTVWKNSLETVYEEALHDACDSYYEELQRFFSDDKPRKRYVLFKLLESMREEVKYFI